MLSNDNVDANSNNIIFTIKDTKLCVLVITLSAKDNEKLSKLFCKVFECVNSHSGNKDTTKDNRYFLKSDFVGVNRLLALIYSNEDNTKRYIKLKDTIYKKALSRIITSSSMERTFMINPLILI